MKAKEIEMAIEQYLFWLAVFGNVMLAYYALRAGLKAIGSFARSETVAGMKTLSVACVLAVLALIFPESLISGDREAGKLGLVVCLLTPFVAMIVNLWRMRIQADRMPSELSGGIAWKSQKAISGSSGAGGLFPSDNLLDPCNPLYPDNHS